MKEFRGYFMILGAAVFWGISATFAKALLNQRVDTILLVQTRVTFTAIILFLYYRAFKPAILRVPVTSLWEFGLLGILGVAGSNFTYYFTMRESTVATAILIQYTAPLLVMGYAILWGGEVVTRVKIIATILSLTGCFLAVSGGSLGELRITPIGLVSGIASIFSFAFLTLYTRHLLSKYNVWTTIFYSIVGATAFWIVVNPPWLIPFRSLDGMTWGALVILAIGSILIPYTLYFAGLRYVVPSRAIITSTLEPIVGIVSAAIALGEYLEPVRSGGAVLVILAIVMLQFRRESMKQGMENRE